MSNPVHAFVLLVVIVIWFGPAYVAGRVADRKGRSFGLYLVAGLLIGPIVLIGALLLPRSRRPA